MATATLQHTVDQRIARHEARLAEIAQFKRDGSRKSRNLQSEQGRHEMALAKLRQGPVAQQKLPAEASHQREAGMTRLQQITLDALHPEGWTVASWLNPSVLLQPDDHQLSEFDNPNLFGGGHYVVNGYHIIMNRRGKFMGYYAWGGRQVPTNGARRPWNALVLNPDASGYYGEHRTPRKDAGVVRSYGI